MTLSSAENLEHLNSQYGIHSIPSADILFEMSPRIQSRPNFVPTPCNAPCGVDQNVAHVGSLQNTAPAYFKVSSCCLWTLQLWTLPSDISRLFCQKT